ncbi:MAG: hypothetical protein AB7U29_14845 [Desulfobulbus sp.]
MNNKFKIAATVASALILLGGGSFGLWLAWDSGEIGSNPRAPVAKAMEDAVRKQAAINNRISNSFASCIPLELNRPPAEIRGIPGIVPRVFPGSYRVTLFSQINLRYQPARDIQLRQMDYLTSQGLFSVMDSSVVTDDGIHSAKTYQLTWDGYVVNQKNYDNSMCLNFGQRQFVRIEKIEKLLEKVLDYDVYEVTYLNKTQDVPAWASNSVASNIFEKLPESLADSRGKAKVVRAKNGWRPVFEIEMEAMAAAKGRDIKNRLLQFDGLANEMPSIDLVKTLVRQKMTDVRWASRYGMACLPINLPNGGDDKIKIGGKRENMGITVTYYDRDDRKQYDSRVMAKALHILTALEGAGLAKMEQLKPPPVPKGAKKVLYNNTGIRYWVSREGAEALGLTNGDRGCIPAGALEPEVLALQKHRGRVQFVARGNIRQTPEWVEKIGDRLPALQLLLKYGLPMSGELVFAHVDGEDRWQLQNMVPHYPELSYDNIPSAIAPLMPKTVNLVANKSVKTPVLAQPISSPSQKNVQPKPNSFPPQYNISPEKATSVLEQLSAHPPYAAGTSPVHVVSIYEGLLSRGGKRGFQQHPEGLVNLNVAEPDAVLLLFAYEPVEWHIKVADGIKLKRIIATGYYAQRVTLDGGGKPQVVTSRTKDLFKKAGLSFFNGFTYGQEPNNLVDIAMMSRVLTGVMPQTYQGLYKISDEHIVIDPHTPRFSQPKRLTPDSYRSRGGITFHGDAVEGNRMLRGDCGAFTDAWSDRIYSGGKVYFEGRMRVAGSMVAHTHANIGLCLARGKGIESGFGETMVITPGTYKLYKDGDVFGIAADFDQQRLYFHVNGHWITGIPGSGYGLPLVQGKEYRACSFSSGTIISEVNRGITQSDTTWEINSGETLFSKSIPSGYAAFLGN